MRLCLAYATFGAHGHVSKPIAQELDQTPKRNEGIWQRVTRADDVLRGAGTHSIAEQKIQSLGLLPTPY